MNRATSLTGSGNYFEDFSAGMVIRHARGKTVTALENVLITNMVMNTAAGHFNEHLMSQHPLGKIAVYGGVTFSLVLGLASQDCCENALAELGLNSVRLVKPVGHGDTLYAYTEVLETGDAEQAGAGLVSFRHYGYNQADELVVQVDRKVLLKRRPQ